MRRTSSNHTGTLARMLLLVAAVLVPRLMHLEYLRKQRNNGASALNRQATVLRNFYRAIVAMGHLEPRQNPMAHFPRIKPAPAFWTARLRQSLQRIAAACAVRLVLGRRPILDVVAIGMTARIEHVAVAINLPLVECTHEANLESASDTCLLADFRDLVGS